MALAADPGSGEASWREVYSGAAMLTRAASLQPGRQYMFRCVLAAGRKQLLRSVKRMC